MKDGRSPTAQAKVQACIAANKPARYPFNDDVLRERQRAIALVANDTYACAFQSMGQYRSALMKALRAGA
jgi:hypothetical protein